MSMSSGTRGLLFEVASWALAAGMVAAALANYDELKEFTYATLGIPSAAESDLPQQAAIQEPEPAPVSGDRVQLKASRHGHFFTEARVNGRPIDVMVDTGASMVALTYEDAERAGIYLNHSDFTHRVSTANGIARVAPVTLDRVSIGGIKVRNVRAAVSERGSLRTTLLGMSFLSQLDRVDMRSGVLTLED